MKMRTFWLNLGWLVVLVVTFAVPLTLDAFSRLNYFTSLTMWLIPILYLWPTFAMLTANGTGRRRRALLATVALIVGLGVVLDFVIGFLTLRFPGCTDPNVAPTGRYLLCLPAVNGRIPIEELLFYAMGPVAMVLVYACADERWLSKYNPPDDLVDLKLIQVSPRIALVGAAGAVAAVDSLARQWDVSDLLRIPGGGRRAARDVPVPLYRRADELAGVRGHDALRHPHVGDLGGDAGDSAVVVGIRAFGNDRGDDRGVVARRLDLSDRGRCRVALRTVRERADLRVRQSAHAPSQTHESRLVRRVTGRGDRAAPFRADVRTLIDGVVDPRRHAPPAFDTSTSCAMCRTRRRGSKHQIVSPWGAFGPRTACPG